MNRVFLSILIGAFLLSSVQASEPIRVGVSLPLTGSLAHVGEAVVIGIHSHIDQINAKGGIYGQKIQLEIMDDHYDPLKTVANTIQLIENKKVDLLFCYVGTDPVKQILPILKKRRAETILLLFSYTGALSQREAPYNQYTFNLRPSYQQEAVALVEQFVKDGKHKIGVFYQMDGYGRSAHHATKEQLKSHGLKIVVDAAYPRASTYQYDYSMQARLMNEDTLDAIIVVGTYEASAGFVRDLRGLGNKVPVAMISFSNSKGVLTLLEAESQKTGIDYTKHLIFSEVVPNTILSADLPAVVDYLSKMKAKGLVGDPIGFEGYLNARLLVEALRRVGPDFKREKLVAAMNSLNDYDLGIHQPIQFNTGDNQAFDRTYQYAKENGKWRLAFPKGGQ